MAGGSGFLGVIDVTANCNSGMNSEMSILLKHFNSKHKSKQMAHIFMDDTSSSAGQGLKDTAKAAIVFVSSKPDQNGNSFHSLKITTKTDCKTMNCGDTQHLICKEILKIAIFLKVDNISSYL